jgi:hypothetical protein
MLDQNHLLRLRLRLVPCLALGFAACWTGGGDTSDAGEAEAGGDPVRGPWGHLASAGHEGQLMVATLFFAGEARDGTKQYEYSTTSNIDFYT